MPIDYRIDHERRLVLAEGHGVVAAEEFFTYQREVWSRPDVSGYDEIVDMTDAPRIIEPSEEAIRALAERAARGDSPEGNQKLAIVAPQDLAFGLGRMYQTYRGLSERSTKQVEVFRDRTAALVWLRRGNGG